MPAKLQESTQLSGTKRRIQVLALVSSGVINTNSAQLQTLSLQVRKISSTIPNSKCYHENNRKVVVKAVLKMIFRACLALYTKSQKILTCWANGEKKIWYHSMLTQYFYFRK